MKEPDSMCSSLPGPVVASNAPLAIMDIGSNAVRFRIYEGLRRNPKILFEDRFPTGLGRGLLTGLPNPEGEEKTLQVLRRAKFFFDKFEIKEPYIFGTEAVRSVLSEGTFLNQAQEILKVPVCVLSGEEEATLGMQGVTLNFKKFSGLVADYGGGSLELAWVSEGNVRKTASLKIGGWFLLGLHQRGEDVPIVVEEVLGSVDWLSELKGQPLFPMGAWNNLARLFLQRHSWPIQNVYGLTLPADKLRTFCLTLETDELTEMDRLYAKCALSLHKVLDKSHSSEVIFTHGSIVGGIYWSLLPAEIREEDLLLSVLKDTFDPKVVAWAQSHYHSFQHPEVAIVALCVGAPPWIGPSRLPLLFEGLGPFAGSRQIFRWVLNLPLGGVLQPQKVAVGALIQALFESVNGSFRRPLTLGAIYQAILRRNILVLDLAPTVTELQPLLDFLITTWKS